ncbi:MAG: LysM peptidoglycan-binding domain-containing protein [Akkermansiaceae bacterium]|jgi:LysM repeat protein
MKTFALTATLALSLVTGATGKTRSELLSQISLKEKQLAEIQKEILDLRKGLTSAPAATQSTGGSYTVKASDTIYSIARAHKVTAKALMERNQITDPTKLAEGRVIMIPGGDILPPASGAKVPALTTTAKTDYVVETGDTFYSIARRHGMSLADLKALNPNVKAHLIAPGQKISVTGKAGPRVAKAPAPAPVKKTTTKTSTRIATVNKPVSTVAAPPKKPVSKPAPVAKNVPVPPTAPSPPKPPVMKEVAPKDAFTSIFLTKETTFDAFAQKHGTTTQTLNELNGWNLPGATVLARGSEIQIPN